MDNQDKRKRLRIGFKAIVAMRFPQTNTLLTAAIKNISMKGIFMETDRRFPFGTP